MNRLTLRFLKSKAEAGATLKEIREHLSPLGVFAIAYGGDEDVNEGARVALILRRLVDDGRVRRVRTPRETLYVFIPTPSDGPDGI